MGSAFSNLFHKPTKHQSGDTPTTNNGNYQSTHPNAHITQRNLRTSGLHTLPTELLLLIDTHLPPTPLTHTITLSHHKWLSVPHAAASITSYQALRHQSTPGGRMTGAPIQCSCAKPPSGNSARRNEKASFSRTTSPKRDWQLVCSICRAAHREHCFTPQARAAPPEKRVCRGTTGVLEICPHARVTFHGIRLKPVEMQCYGEHGGTGLGFSVVKVCEREMELGSRKVRVDVLLALCEVEPKERLAEGGEGGEEEEEEEEEAEEEEGGDSGGEAQSWLKQRILDSLQKADWRICPHIYTQRLLPHLAHKLVSSPDAHKCSWRCGFGAFCAGKCRAKWPTMSCTAPFCDTQVTLLKEARSDTGSMRRKEYVFVKIERCLGGLQAADEEGWLAQIVDPSQLEDLQVLDARKKCGQGIRGEELGDQSGAYEGVE